MIDRTKPVRQSVSGRGHSLERKKRGGVRVDFLTKPINLSNHLHFFKLETEWFVLAPAPP